MLYTSAEIDTLHTDEELNRHAICLEPSSATRSGATASAQASCASIMARCGMRDLNTFYKAFTAQTGITPRQYRKEKQKGVAHMNILNEISEKLQIAKAKLVKELVQQAIDEGIAAQTILTEGLLSGMNVVAMLDALHEHTL